MNSKRDTDLLEHERTRSIIGAFFDVHRGLGFGFREYIYALALQRDLVSRGHRVDREVAIPVYYRGEPLAWQTLDMIVDERLVVEIKATDRLHSSSTGQLFGYLCATKFEVGLLLHFGRQPKFYRVICENHLKRQQRADCGPARRACDPHCRPLTVDGTDDNGQLTDKDGSTRDSR